MGSSSIALRSALFFNFNLSNSSLFSPCTSEAASVITSDIISSNVPKAPPVSNRKPRLRVSQISIRHPLEPYNGRVSTLSNRPHLGNQAFSYLWFIPDYKNDHRSEIQMSQSIVGPPSYHRWGATLDHCQWLQLTLNSVFSEEQHLTTDRPLPMVPTGDSHSIPFLPSTWESSPIAKFSFPFSSAGILYVKRLIVGCQSPPYPCHPPKYRDPAAIDTSGKHLYHPLDQGWDKFLIRLRQCH